MRSTLILLVACCPLLVSCAREPETPEQAQRISLEAARQKPATPVVSPDTAKAAWSVAGNGQSITFGNAGQPPFLTLACDLRVNPSEIHIIRHVPGRPGQQALFPVLGAGPTSRFKLDTALVNGEWRWQGSLPASHPQLDVFITSASLEATLPGGGTLRIKGSRIPGEFVQWCRTTRARPSS